MNNFSSVGGTLSQPPPVTRMRPPPAQSGAPELQQAADQVKSVSLVQTTAHVASLGKTPSAGQLSKLIEDMQKKIATYSPELQFSIDQSSGKTIVRMTDKSTNTLLWQFPSEEAMQVAKELDQYQRGLVVNRKA